MADATAIAGPQDTASVARSFRAAKERALVRWERGYIAELLSRHNGNLSRAARAARMDRTHLRELGRRYHLLPPSTADDTEQ